eukprot:TRINITY_DN2790_c0_g1_i1.p1 TRINITY_DN2790_c0_g1~~TRINITY_DN2790_c0_g1_i1.p1  ORF type:complete len:321 (+),score=80.93 TRINITY_DN2790_c0_g1_i1:443-1405(+)
MFPKAGSNDRFTRVSRVDKGVHACGFVCGFNAFMRNDDWISEVNKLLPEQIRVFGSARVTKGFNARRACEMRRYKYYLPAGVFSPTPDVVLNKKVDIFTDLHQLYANIRDYEVNDEDLERFNKILQKYVGRHNFWNFTSGINFGEATAYRHMYSLVAEEPLYVPYKDQLVGFVPITILGQSFMLHQIRKMIHLAVLIYRGLAPLEMIDLAYMDQRVRIDRAPGEFLCLDFVYFEKYMKNRANGRLHQDVHFSDCRNKADDFREEVILPEMGRLEVANGICLEYLKHSDQVGWLFERAEEIKEARKKIDEMMKQRTKVVTL